MSEIFSSNVNANRSPDWCINPEVEHFPKFEETWLSKHMANERGRIHLTGWSKTAGDARNRRNGTVSPNPDSPKTSGLTWTQCLAAT